MKTARVRDSNHDSPTDSRLRSKATNDRRGRNPNPDTSTCRPSADRHDTGQSSVVPGSITDCLSLGGTRSRAKRKAQPSSTKKLHKGIHRFTMRELVRTVGQKLFRSPSPD